MYSMHTTIDPILYMSRNIHNITPTMAQHTTSTIGDYLRFIIINKGSKENFVAQNIVDII